MQNINTVNLRLWTVEEYHRMAEAGIFDEDERVELLEGNIICKSSDGITGVVGCYQSVYCWSRT